MKQQYTVSVTVNNTTILVSEDCYQAMRHLIKAFGFETVDTTATPAPTTKAPKAPKAKTTKTTTTPKSETKSQKTAPAKPAKATTPAAPAKDGFAPAKDYPVSFVASEDGVNYVDSDTKAFVRPKDVRTVCNNTLKALGFKWNADVKAWQLVKNDRRQRKTEAEFVANHAHVVCTAAQREAVRKAWQERKGM